MYKIYINDRPLTVCATSDLPDLPPEDEYHLIARYPGKPKFILNYVDTLEKGSPRVLAITLHADDVEALWDDFRRHFHWLEAAGGLVTNSNNEWLLIFRRGYWDLPKGKIDDGESHEAAALREVREETGLRQLSLGPLLHTTYHTYRDRRKRRILKPTYWFRMTTAETELIPQQEEDIDQAVWMDEAAFFSEPRPVYNSIRDVMRAAGAEC